MVLEPVLTDRYVSAMKITIRDGRAGHSSDSTGKGVVLAVVDRPSPLDEGDIIALGDGATVIVIGSEERFNTEEYAQTVFVGSVPA
jgi:hypothetical protein